MASKRLCQRHHDFHQENVNKGNLLKKTKNRKDNVKKLEIETFLIHKIEETQDRKIELQKERQIIKRKRMKKENEEKTGS